MDERSRGSREWKLLSLALTIGVIALVCGVVGIALGARRVSSAASSSAGSGGNGSSKTFDVELTEMKITPASVTVAAGTNVTLNVKNVGAAPHNVSVNGKTTRDLKTGESQSLNIGVVKTTTQAWCNLPGHKDAGMVFTINVDGTAAAGDTGSSKDAAIDPNATPGKDWKARDPQLAPASAETTHTLTLRAQDKEVEVAPGVKQLLWTFEGTTPGPILRGHIGDTFDVTLVNDGKLGHSLDFHASFAPWDTQMRTINPGESLQYKFTADKSGVFMYHCGTAPALHHIGNGMFGAIIIDPPNLAPVAHEYALVQSEYYLGPQGETGSLKKMVANQWDAVTFNGYYNQYKFAPIKVNPNERIRVWVLDAGPSENSSFHIVGTIFDTVYKEGAYTLQPSEANGGAQALDLQPAQGGFVEFSLHDVGLYPIVTHKFSNVGKGALGLFQAGEPAPHNGGGH